MRTKAKILTTLAAGALVAGGATAGAPRGVYSRQSTGDR